uniref:Ig-like domain-containing protein n=1 Tax=Strigops habroptila TaxID=2489341 RepID=A0A672UDN3_STRHB
MGLLTFSRVQSGGFTSTSPARCQRCLSGWCPSESFPFLGRSPPSLLGELSASSSSGSSNICTLTINDINPNDEGTYYCAYCTWIKYFGAGTKVIVSGKGSSPPANSEILQKEHENQITYVCLVEKFYPEVIRVTWTDEKNEEVTDNVVKGDTWMATKSDEYSIGSWLTVPVENKDKNYYCKYEHESQERSLPTQETQGIY